MTLAFPFLSRHRSISASTQNSSRAADVSESALTRLRRCSCLLCLLDLGCAISNICGCCRPRAMSAAEKAPSHFHTVADYSALAVLTGGRNRLNCTLQTVESMSCPVGYQLESLVVFVTANFAFRHWAPRPLTLYQRRITSLRPSGSERCSCRGWSEKAAPDVGSSCLASDCAL
jgi:hypothetical protein